jgi:hypothetical protein
LPGPPAGSLLILALLRVWSIVWFEVRR